MTEQEIQLKKFVWAYMLEAGHETDGEWDYYGGRYRYIPRKDYYNFDARKKNQKNLLHLIKEVGVDWEKTQMPQSSQQSEFTDTFHPPKEVEALLGTLILKDGNEVMIGVGGAETRFKNYIETLQQLMNDRKSVEDMFG